MAIGRDTPVSNKTVYEWMKRGHFPKKLQVPYGAAVWDTEECLLKLGFK
ncbi:TPA: helix-turn-helix transcriptional regulator [Neisseria lactamica]